MAHMSDGAFSPEQVACMRSQLLLNSRHRSDQVTAVYHTTRLADSAQVPPAIRLTALLLCDYMLLDLSFRGWSPKVRGEACFLTAVVTRSTWRGVQKVIKFEELRSCMEALAVFMKR